MYRSMVMNDCLSEFDIYTKKSHLTLAGPGNLSSVRVELLPRSDGISNLHSMTLSLRRIWYPYQRFLPTPAWFKHQYLVYKLNSYLEGKIMSRWNDKFARGKYDGQPQDMLDRLLASCDRDHFLKGGLVVSFW